MNIDNWITIDKKTFEVLEFTGYGIKPITKIGKGKSIEEAIDIAEKYKRENLIEYDIKIV